MSPSYNDIVLLNDETHLSNEEIKKRVNLGIMIADCFPKDVFAYLSVCQPSVGCLNRCSFCSQEAGTQLRFLNGASIRTIAGALRRATKIITYKRNYKPGILFPYLDNDIGSYPFLLDYLVAADSLGVRVRISTIGWSRKNAQLNEMHQKILQKYVHTLAGVRFSLTSYSAAWRTSRSEFILDFINSIQTYHSLLRLKDSEGNSGVCIDIDFKPDILPCKVEIIQYDGYQLICGDSYFVVVHTSKQEVGKNQKCWLVTKVDDYASAVRTVKKAGLFPVDDSIDQSFCIVNGHVTTLKNEDGVYYGFYPDSSQHTTDGIFFFPKTETRLGGVFNACWPLREFRNYIQSQSVDIATYDDMLRVEQIFITCTKHVPHRKEYLQEYFAPMFDALCKVLEALEIHPMSLFDNKLVRDRGMIRNSGRAYYEFRQIASGPNIMVVPDPVLSADNTDIVWRIFPAMISQSSQPMSEIGRKSSIPIPSKQCCEESYNDKLCLIAWEVDAPSHSHNRNDGTLRDSLIIPIADFVDPMKTYNLTEGKKLFLLPGV